MGPEGVLLGSAIKLVATIDDQLAGLGAWEPWCVEGSATYFQQCVVF
jgi:hypothetical protein